MTSSQHSLGDGGPGSIYIQEGTEIAKNLKETFYVDNSNGQLNYYLTLDEEETDMVFTNIHISNYAKLQVVADGEYRTLNLMKVYGDGTGLFRMRNNQKGMLERIASGNNTVSKLQGWHNNV